MYNKSLHLTAFTVSLSRIFITIDKVTFGLEAKYMRAKRQVSLVVRRKIKKCSWP